MSCDDPVVDCFGRPRVAHSHSAPGVPRPGNAPPLPRVNLIAANNHRIVTGDDDGSESAFFEVLRPWEMDCAGNPWCESSYPRFIAKVGSVLWIRGAGVERAVAEGWIRPAAP